MRTEVSTKFQRAALEAELVARRTSPPIRFYTDPADDFGLVLSLPSAHA